MVFITPVYNQMMRILVLLLIPFSIFGQKAVSVSSVSQNVTSQISVFSGPASTGTFEEITGKAFTPFGKDNFIAVASDKVYWFKLSVKNPSPSPAEWVLECKDNGIEYVNFYVPDSKGGYGVIRQGPGQTPKKNSLFIEYPHVSFTLAPHTSQTIYIQLSGARTLICQLLLHPSEKYGQKVLNDNLRFGLVGGALLLRLFYVFLLAVFAVKKPIFRVYVIYLLAGFLAYTGLHNTLGGFLAQDPGTAIKINTLSNHFKYLAYLIFALYVLPIRQFSPLVRYFFYIGIALNLIVGGLIYIDYQWYWTKLSMELSVYFWPPVIVLLIFSKYKKLYVDWYYAIPYVVATTNYVIVRMISIGWFGGSIQQIMGLVTLISLLELTFFGYFLGNMIKGYEKSKLSSEKELAFEKAQAERLTELDTLKTNFFANISHEFRTPLTLILSPLSDLRKEFPKREIFRLMQQNAERLLALINQLLDLSKLEAGKMRVEIREADLAQFFRQLLSSFESLAQSKHVVFQYEQSHLAKIAYFDADKTGKILTNLLSNAFKFTPEQGRIEVRVDYNDRDCVIKVSDSGIGIAAERIPKIFDRFYQAEHDTDRNFEGTGIGLALVKELVEALQGKIEVTSQIGKGTVFTVTIPCDQATWKDYLSNHETVPAEATASLVTPWIRSPFSVDSTETVSLSENAPILLIAEDNPDLRAYIHGIFKDSYQILEARDGQEGLELALEHIPDIIISDLMMPHLDGFGLCKALKTDLRTNHIPVIMLTAKATLEDRLEGLGLGADEYLAKPFSTDELHVRVRNLLKQREILQQKYGRLPQENEPITTPGKVPPVIDVFLQKVNTILASNFTDSSLDVEKFAAETGITSVQLRRKLKALTGQTVTEYLRNYRLEKAAELLTNGTRTVSEIAYQVGFESLPYFSKVFQDKFGKNPSEWS